MSSVVCAMLVTTGDNILDYNARALNGVSVCRIVWHVMALLFVVQILGNPTKNSQEWVYAGFLPCKVNCIYGRGICAF